MVTFNPKINSENPFGNYNVNGINPFSSGASSYKPEPVAERGYNEDYGNGKAIGKNSTGVQSEVTGCGPNGEFALKGFNGGALYA